MVRRLSWLESLRQALDNHIRDYSIYRQVVYCHYSLCYSLLIACGLCSSILSAKSSSLSSQGPRTHWRSSPQSWTPTPPRVSPRSPSCCPSASSRRDLWSSCSSWAPQPRPTTSGTAPRPRTGDCWATLWCRHMTRSVGGDI